jgi:hypothetical protein
LFNLSNYFKKEKVNKVENKIECIKCKKEVNINDTVYFEIGPVIIGIGEIFPKETKHICMKCIKGDK